MAAPYHPPVAPKVSGPMTTFPPLGLSNAAGCCDLQPVQPLRERVAVVAGVRSGPIGRLQVEQQLPDVALTDLVDLCASKEIDHSEVGGIGQGENGHAVHDRGELTEEVSVETTCHLHGHDLPVAAGRLEIVQAARSAWRDSAQRHPENLFEAMACKNFGIV